MISASSPFQIGIMLGRLSAKYNQPLQSFPLKTWLQEIKSAKSLNLDCIEWVEDGVSDLENPLFSSEGRSCLVKLQEDNKMYIDSICCHSFISGGLISQNIHHRKQWIKRLQSILGWASEIKSKAIIIPLMERSAINNSLKENIFLDSMNQIKVNHDVKILLETDLPAVSSLRVLKEVNADHFGLVYDFGNATQLQFDIYNDIQLLHSVIGEVHFKDKDLISSYRLGCGKTNFLLAAKALNEFQWKGRCILETPIFHDWEAEANHNVAFAKKFISSLKLS